jgi:hypothetical protein
MIKRVKLDKNGLLSEIDLQKTCRAAVLLQEYILKADPAEATTFKYFEKVLPIVKLFLAGDLPLPYKGGELYDYRAIMEGYQPELPRAFSELYLSFMFKIEHSISQFSLSTHESGEYIFNKYEEEDEFGDVYALCWFED